MGHLDTRFTILPPDIVLINAGRLEELQRCELVSDALRRDCDAAMVDVAVVSRRLHHFSQLYSDRAAELQDEQCSPDSASIQCRVSRNGRPGRPAVIVPKDLIEILLEQGYSYASIAKMLGISYRTLLRRRVEHQLPLGRLYSEVSDNDLDSLVREITHVSL